MPPKFLDAIAPLRRPAGWQAPGPPPATPRERHEVWPRPGEDLSCLSGDWRILQQRRGHRWSLDDLATAWFAVQHAGAPAPRQIADLGCGIGAVLLLLAWSFPAARCTGIEAQPESAALARRSIGWNGVEARVAVRGGDLRDAPVLADLAPFDLITGTPPYLPPGSGCVPIRLQQAGCHFEERGGIEAYCDAAARWLAPSGCFVACHAAPQRARVEAAAAAAGLTIMVRRAVVPREGKAPLFVLYAMRHAPARIPVIALPPLVVRGGDTRWTAELRAVRAAMGMPV